MDGISSDTTFVSPSSQEMLRIGPDGFYVRGVKLEQDENEARTVYEAFIAWMKAAGIQVPPRVAEPNPDFVREDDPRN